jgi:hypothetical protein
MSSKLSLFPRAFALASALMIAALPALAQTSTPAPGANMAASDTKPATQVSGETDKKTDSKTDKSKTHAAAHKTKDHAMTKTAAAGNAQKQPVAQKPAAKTSEEPAKTDTAK